MAKPRIQPPGRMVRVQDRDLHVTVQGSGSPLVVLESGIAASSLSWSLVQPAVAEFTSVLSYDRPGLGWSEAGTRDGTALSAAHTLAALLDAVDIAEPYVLVGHSFGGLIVRLFQQQYPERVRGLVLADPVIREDWRDASTERLRMLARGVRLSRRGAMLARLGIVGGALRLLTSGFTRIPKMMSRVSAGNGSSVTDRLAGEVRKLPRELWPAIAMHWSQARSFHAMANNLEQLPRSAAQLDESRTLGDLPITVLSVRPTPEHAHDAALSTKGRHVLVENSGHWVQLDRPDVVIQAIRNICGA